jgi:hypothetical protein
MATQVENGKAFEWATALAMSDATGVEILDSPEAKVALACFSKVSASLKERFIQSSELAVQHILEKESSSDVVNSPKTVRLASDANGQRGDVRDVVLVGVSGKELGISCKTNHDAFKHPRISGSIDFVRKWGLDANGCSPEYWRVARPIFQKLKLIRTQSNATELWENHPETHHEYYKPLLEAFAAEIFNRTSKDALRASEVTAALVDYIIGKYDFYKVICRPESVHIEGFNLNGTLSISSTPYPAFCIAIDDFDGGAFSKTIRLQKGMTFDFRIHTASKRVEPSFKFDVRAVGLPSDVYQNHISLSSSEL